MSRIVGGWIVPVRSFFIGASTVGGLLFAVLQSSPCIGLYRGGDPFPTFNRLNASQCSDVGAYGTFSGVWVDGFEERRFFPNMTGAPNETTPETDTLLIIDEAAADMAGSLLPEQSGKIRRQYVFIRFRGNELRPRRGWNAGQNSTRLITVRDIISVRLLKREY